MSQTDVPISDAIPGLTTEQVEAPNPKPSDLERIVKQYPDFIKRLEQKITHYQQFHPSGVAIEGLTEEERMKWWAHASVIVKEFTSLRNQVIANTKKRD